MNFIGQHKEYVLHPLARPDGKLKSFTSCNDIRAWSHDLRERDRYLREWIKCDMPLCVVPISTLVGFLRAMTCSKPGTVTPCCHPNCKSKKILESIIASCESMRECLKDERNLYKFFCEEEFETSHWPCDRSLEALKTIKMFWKILLEKVYAINLTKNDCLKDRDCSCDSLQDVVRHWKEDIVHQAKFVKTLTPQLCNKGDDNCKKSCLKKSSSCNIVVPPKQCCGGDKKDPPCTCTTDNCRCVPLPPPPSQKRVTLDCALDCTTRCNPLQKRHKSPKRTCKCVSVRVKVADACCGISNPCEVETYKSNIDCLQRNNSMQQEEIERLQQEIQSLKCELQKRNCKWDHSSLFCAPALISGQNHSMIPKPYEDDSSSTKSCAKGADSELLITMKNCKHDSYKHVNLLQILHKTNDPRSQEKFTSEPCYKNEDPIELLTKVQATLGAMVRREMIMAQMRQSRTDSEIEASFQRLASKPSDCEL